MPGVSENIRVRSIVGRFLEHSRVFYFENGGEPELYCASADWMERNFFRRVEVAFPMRRAAHRERILRDLETYLRDNTQAWQLGSATALYTRCSPDRSSPHQCADPSCWRATRPASTHRRCESGPRALKTRSRKPCAFRWSISCCRSAVVSG